MRILIKSVSILFILAASCFAEDYTLFTRQQAISSALSSNAAYKASQEDSKASYYQYRSSWGAYLPSADLSYSYGESENTSTNTYSANLGINVFNGFRSYQNMRSAELKYKISGENEREQRLMLARDVSVAYQAVLKAAYLRQTSGTLFESADLVLQEARLKTDLGALSRVDLFQAEADREKAYTNMLDAELAYTEAMQELSRLTGVLSIDGMRLDDTWLDVTALPYEQYIDTAMQYNTSITTATFNQEIADRAYKSSLGTYLPTVDASLSTNWAESNKKGDYNSNSVGLTVRWNVFSGFSDYNTMLADARSRVSARHTKVDQTNTITYRIKTTVRKLETNIKKLSSAELYVKAAAESYSARQEMFRIGRASLNETIDARATLQDAQASLADAQYNIVQSYEDLNYLVGGGLTDRSGNK